MIYLDGSYGEGGGQIIRTALSLAAITGQPFCIEGIRAGRKKPGLAAQHLTAVRATATICNAQVRGDAIGSMRLEFTPGSPPQPGYYTFDVTEAQQGGSAGAITLVLQTILLPLALASGDSQITLRGGTHVAYSPPYTYIEQVYLPILKQMGLEADVKLRAWGWYPQGGGEVSLRVTGDTFLDGINLINRGKLRQVKGFGVATELPSHIPQRMVSRAQNLLQEAQLRATIQPLREKGNAPGAGIFLTAEYENSKAGFGAVGKIGVASEKLAEMACTELINFHKTNAPVDVHLADQLMLPAALASDSSQYKVAEISEHSRTNAWVIQQFGIADVHLDEKEKLIKITKFSNIDLTKS